MERNNNPCIAMVPSPGFSHLVPLIEFSKRLVVHRPHFQITFFIPTLGPPSPSTLSIFESLPPYIHFTILPHVKKEDLKAEHPVTQMHRTVTISLPSLNEALSSFINSHTHLHLVAMVADTFSFDALDIAKKFNLKFFGFSCSSAALHSFVLHFPELHEDNKLVPTADDGFRELSQPLKLPGCINFQAQDLPDPVFERSSEAYKTILHMCKRIRSVDGIILNSFQDLERETIRALEQSNHNNFPPVYPVGPILQTESHHINKSISSASNCLTWLDNQPRNSVLYVSFGSGGTLSHDQLHELALGLEMSGHKFLWVVRAPNEDAGSAYLTEQKEDPFSYLPKGFIERTKDQGFVVPSWAPQVEVLSHESTSGFLTHCGWNSVLEGIVYGKPMIAWPLFAEQKMNAVMLTEQFKVAVRPKGDENKNEIVKREEVCRVVKILMECDEGIELRKRIQVFKDAARKALSEDGSSTRVILNLSLG